LNTGSVTVELPGGSWLGGERTLTARLRAPTGVEQAMLQELGGEHTPAERVTALLAELVLQLPGVERVDAEAIRGLTVGDREAIALAVRRMTFGERLDCTLTCPSCDESLDIPATVADFLHAPYARSREWHEAVVGNGETVRFRLPTGGDQEDAARRVAAGPDVAADALFESCVEGAAAELGPDARAEVARAMAELDPQADIVLTLDCPECEAAVEAPFDAASYLLDEIDRGTDDLLVEIHTLASGYHWSERDIVELPIPRRRRYLELVADAPAEP
jgi:hypothetical protein